METQQRRYLPFLGGEVPLFLVPKKSMVFLSLPKPQIQGRDAEHGAPPAGKNKEFMKRQTDLQPPKDVLIYFRIPHPLPLSLPLSLSLHLSLSLFGHILKATHIQKAPSPELW